MAVASMGRHPIIAYITQYLLCLSVFLQKHSFRGCSLIFSWTKKYVRPVLRESWRCRWGQDERNTLTSSAFCRRPARACCSVSIGFTECVVTPSVQKQALYDYSTLAARPRSTWYENIWNIRRHKKGKTQGEITILKIYLHSFSHKKKEPDEYKLPEEPHNKKQ